jgi:hypothetical protein
VPRTPLKKNFFGQPGPESDLVPLGRFTVWLDQTDRVIAVPGNWAVHGARIGSPDLDREQVLGRPVGWFVQDLTTRECFRMLFERIRREGRSARVVTRCDSPTQQRAMQIRFVPMSAGALECSWSLFLDTAASEIPLQQRYGFEDGEFIRMCSWCRQVHLHGRWQALESVAAEIGLLGHDELPAITHGICPRCAAALMAEDEPSESSRLAV